MLLSDNWDIWQGARERGGQAVNLTVNGKKTGVRYRGAIAIDPRGASGIDLSRPLVRLDVRRVDEEGGHGR